MRDFGGKRPTTWDPDKQPPAAGLAPGKRTLVEMLPQPVSAPVQRKAESNAPAPTTPSGPRLTALDLFGRAQRKDAGAGPDAATVDTSTQQANAASASPPSRLDTTLEIDGPTGSGRPLEPGVQAKMSAAFATDFSSVRVHETGQAERIGAHAFAYGDALHFAAGQYAPRSERGQELIGHELAHVVQQRSGRVAGPQGKDATVVTDASLEHEADAAGAAAARGEPTQIATGGSGGTAIQAKWVTPLGPSGQRQWEADGGGNAPSGMYAPHTSIRNRWIALFGGSQYVESGGQLNKSDEVFIDFESGRTDPATLPRPTTGSPMRAAPPLASASPAASSARGQPDLSIAQQTIASLFEPGVLGDPKVQDLINRVIGVTFAHWAKQGIDDSVVQQGIDQVIRAKLAELCVRYRNLELVDMVVIYSYSWYADKYIREAGAPHDFQRFGDWDRFVDQLKQSVRKLRRFTGAVLYRCSRPNEEGDQIQGDKPWKAGSFLSTTYTPEARDELEKNDKYQRGKTLHLDARDAEGYHIEELSQFRDEHEVIVMPGHTIASNGRHGGRVVGATLTSPTPLARLPPGPSSAAEFEALRQGQSRALPPPPPSKLPASSSSAVSASSSSSGPKSPYATRPWMSGMPRSSPMTPMMPAPAPAQLQPPPPQTHQQPAGPTGAPPILLKPDELPDLDKLP